MKINNRIVAKSKLKKKKIYNKNKILYMCFWSYIKISRFHSEFYQ